MRWKVETDRVGDYRIEKRFLFFPLRIGNEYRWLETAEIVQECRVFSKWDFYSYQKYWVNIAFYDQNDERWKNIDWKTTGRT